VYGIVKQSDGYVWVASEPDDGARFDVYLPRDEAELEDEVAEPTSSRLFGSGTVLLVEDEDVVRELVREILEANGYVVLEASDGSEAAVLCEAHDGRIDLLLSDVVMPRMGGRELAALVGPKRPDMRILFMSGYPASPGGISDVSEVGGELIEKPFSAAALAERIQEILE
jgi:CheY-like chemotaxis protein